MLVPRSSTMWSVAKLFGECMWRRILIYMDWYPLSRCNVVVTVKISRGTSSNAMMYFEHMFRYSETRFCMSNGSNYMYQLRIKCLLLEQHACGMLKIACFGYGRQNIFHCHLNGPLTRYVQLRVAHAPGIPGTFSPPPTSKETTCWRSRNASQHVRHARAVMHVGFANSRWRGNRSRCMRNLQFYVSGKRPMIKPPDHVISSEWWFREWSSMALWKKFPRYKFISSVTYNHVGIAIL